MGRIGALVLCSSALLSACGGGGGGDTPNSTPPTPPSSGELDLQYQGSTEPADLAGNNSAIFISSAYDFGLSTHAMSSLNSVLSSPRASRYAPSTNLQLSTHSSRASSSETNACESGSVTTRIDISDETFLGEVVTTYNDCGFDGATTSGQIVATIEQVDLSQADNPQVRQLTYTYLDFRTQASDGSYFELEGREVYRGLSTCEQTVTVDMVGASSEPAANLRVDNLVSVQRCDDADGSAYTLSGRLYLGGYGYFDITTVKPVMLWDPATPYDHLAGHIRLSNSRSSISIEGYVSDATGPVQMTRLTVSDGVNEQEYLVPSYFVVSEDLSDFSDSDNDGMWDGYERHVGLDPTVNDAELDSDGDGYSNIVELASFSDPFSAHHTPSFSLEFLVNGTQGYQDLTIYETETQQLSLSLGSSEILQTALIPLLGDTRLELEIGRVAVEATLAQSSYCSLETKPVEYEHCNGSGCELVTEDTQVLECSGMDLSAWSRGQSVPLATLSIVGKEAGTWNLQPSFESDFDMTFYSGNTSVTVNDTSRVATVSTTPWVGLLEEQGETISYQGELYNSAYVDFSLDGQLAADSMDAEILSVTGDGLVCSHSTNSFSCRNDNAYYLIHEYQVELATPSSDGHITFDVSISTEYSPSIIRSVDSTLILALAKPMSEVAALVDALAEGQTQVQVPAGVYSGALSSTKSVELIANGEVALWLAGSYSEPGLDLPDTSKVDGFSIHSVGTDALSLGKDSQVTNNTFTLYSWVNDTITMLGDGVITGNRFLLESQAQAYASMVSYGAGVLFANNLVVAHPHQEITLMEEEYYYSSGIQQLSKLLNNTFINVDTILKPRDYDTVFTNNLVVEEQSEQANAELLGETVEWRVSNNLFPAHYQSVFWDSSVYTDQPQLDDDYAPLSTSPAIDAGSDQSTWLNQDLLGTARPLGSGFDIGAFETH